MSSEIQGYLEDLEEIFQGIPTDSEAVNESPELNSSIQEAEETLEMLRVSIAGLSESQKAAAQREYRAYTERIRSVKRRLLIGGGPAAGSSDVVDDEERHAMNMQRLHEASRQLAQNEETALEIRQQLAQQQEVIANATKNSKEIKGELSVSQKMLTGMSKWWRG